MLQKFLLFVKVNQLFNIDIANSIAIGEAEGFVANMLSPAS